MNARLALIRFAAPRRSRPRRRRRGAIVMLFLAFLVIGVLLAAWTLNWAYLVATQRDMRHVAEAIGLAATPALLDRNVLLGLPGDQSDDLLQAAAAAQLYRELNNSGRDHRKHVQADDVTLTPGRVNHVAALIGPSNPFFENEPYNTLKVEIRRAKDGANPVQPFLNGFWEAEPVDVAATTYITLDNRVVGFRPTANANSPLLPIAVDVGAWNASRLGGDDSNGNGVRELVVRLYSSNDASSRGNAALVALDGGGVSLDRVQSQIAYGATQTELPGGQFGPATPDAPRTLPHQQVVANEIDTAQLATLLNAAVGQRRVLLLYDRLADGGADVIGFVAVQILAADDEETSGDHQRLRFTVEPCFLIHNTAWTEPSIDGEPTPENPYIQKLRLRR